MTQMYGITDWVFVEDMKRKVEAGETLTEEDVANLRRLVDWLDAKQLVEQGFPQEWTT
jgi:hypothetical protein